MKTKGNRARALVAGDRIAVVAPSGPVDRIALAAGIAVLEDAGFVVEMPRERPPWRIFSGTDEERLDELQAALDAPEIQAVWLARGGYGLNRILPMLRLSDPLLARKWVIGFSDATALLTAVEAAGGHAIHGPMVAHDLVREAEGAGFRHLLDLTAGRGWSVPIPTIF
ncbi:MAG: LD-carboxypeptidase, partial [Candidatus Binatia bacterium]|nr:LD-carboxypeptidase [Candidatus Binatia bacterium]